MPSCVDSDCGASTWRQHKLSSSQLTGRLMIQLLCMCVYVYVWGREWVCVCALTWTQLALTAETGLVAVSRWQRGDFSRATKLNWSWRAARRMDSSRSSGSFSRAERRATAANSSRMNSCWKSTTPRWPDSPPGTSTLWSNTAKTRSDSSVSNKVTFLFSRISFIFVLNR